MKKLYPVSLILFASCILFSKDIKAQDCAALQATFQTFESRCAATGSIKVIATGGSGSYKYKVTGPVSTNFTTTDSLTGLSAGTYTVTVNDIVSNCTYTKTGIIVTGSYEDPRFTLTATDVSCENVANGSITVDNLENGRSPFFYTVVAPSTSGIGTTNTTGVFNNLSAGNYYIRLTDSCGGIQTRQALINNYTWNIDSYVFNKISCDTATGYIKVIDSKGNTSTNGTLPGFTYGIVLQAGDTSWSSSPYFTFKLFGQSIFNIVAKDQCGNIKSFSSSVSLVASADELVNMFNKTCSEFSVSLSGLHNFFSPNFCLFDSNNIQIQCNSTGTFNNLPYANYCIKAHDACTDTTLTRCFTATPPLASVGDNVAVSNKTCQSFTAFVTGQNNLTNPQYCLYDTSNVLISCNATGIFDSLSYVDSYCVKIKDGCIDTTITRCFNAGPPTVIIDSIIPVYANCTNFGIHVNADSLANAFYCLYDSAGNLIQCDSSGVFDSIPLGNYCIHVHDACRDTTVINCFSVGPPVIMNDLSFLVSNKTCSTFTATASTANIKNPYYCLYDTANVLISCDSSGIFSGLAYGSYCIKVNNECPDTTFITCINEGPPVPSVNATVNISNNTCTTFSAKIQGQQNLTSPQFCLYDNNNTQLNCNTTGIFNNLLYGNYCIKVTNSCYDTTITRCFTAALMPVNITALAAKSCIYGYSRFDVNITGGGMPFHVKAYTPQGNLLLDTMYTVTGFSIDSIPLTNPSGPYKIVVMDNCSSKDSVSVTPVISYLNHVPAVIAKCPGGASPNGSGDIETNATTNMGALTVRIIKKDNNTLSPQLVPNISGNIYKFDDLGPGNYIVSYNANDACNKYLFDTLTIQSYQFPNLSRSTAYKCDADGFSVNALVTNGVGPFTYEIIGSNPSTPSIIAPPQTDPLFSINNGTNYSLIRLRALDACGNATLGDESILPLAADQITSSSNCFLQPTTLSVDSIYNSTYEWYKKTNAADTDSTFLGSGSSYFIPTVLPADTGIYICHIVVNSGCVTKTYSYNLNASCYVVLPVTLLSFDGTYNSDKVLLNWASINSHSVKTYVVERKSTNNYFDPIGTIKAENLTGYSNQYHFTDEYPTEGNNYYRLKIINIDGSFTYSNIITVMVTRKKESFHIYPNPATDILNISFNTAGNHTYKVLIYNSINQLVKEISFMSGINKQMQVARSKSMNRGMYIVRIIDESTREQYSQKVIFR